MCYFVVSIHYGFQTLPCIWTLTLSTVADLMGSTLASAYYVAGAFSGLLLGLKRVFQEVRWCVRCARETLVVDSSCSEQRFPWVSHSDTTEDLPTNILTCIFLHRPCLVHNFQDPLLAANRRICSVVVTIVLPPLPPLPPLRTAAFMPRNHLHCINPVIVRKTQQSLKLGATRY
jgi:hypothetical protein